jgi:hypothetical protein
MTSGHFWKRSLWTGLALLYLLASACSSGLRMAPSEPIYPYRGLNESTILGPR